MQLIMIGHSTVLIETGGQKILTDPFLRTYGNPAYKRLKPPACSREELQDLAAVLISHSHWDHIDRKFLRMLGDPPVLVPQRMRWMFKLKGGRNLRGLKHWETFELGGIKITAVPALHLIPTIGFVLEAENKAIYFAGDTFLRPFMREIGEKFQLDAALLPVTTFRLPMTMGEKQAVKAVELLKPALVIPIHLGVEPRSPLLRTNQTAEHFAQRLADSGNATPVVILKEGERHTL